MTTSNAGIAVFNPAPKATSLIIRGLVGLVVMTFLSSCVTDPVHQEALKQAKEGPVEEGVAKLKTSSAQQPENQDYRVDFLRERDRVVNQLLLDAAFAMGKNEINEAETLYQRVQSIDAENAQAKLGLKEVNRSRQHAEAITVAHEELNKSDFKAAQNSLKPVLLESPLDEEAQDLNKKIEAARFTDTSQAQVPELSAGYKKSVSLQFRDTNLKMIFEAISKASGLNILYDKDIKSDLKATVFVKQASVEDTINLILMQNQLEKKVLNESTLYIYPATPAKLKEYQDLVIRNFQLVNADAKQMQTLIKTLLKSKDLFVNEKTNSLVMRDTPDIVALAAKLIASQDVDEPEVMLEMEVLEVSHSLVSQLGVAYPNQVSFTVDGAVKTLQDIKGINASKIDITNSLGVTLDLKKTDSDVKTLANPRIRVKQREKAKIHIGERFPIITNTVTPSTGTPVVTGSIQYIDLGLKLEVEPDIHMDGEVGIKTLLEVSSLGLPVSSGSGGSNTTAYRVNTRTANTVLRLKDGETQVLAGLINNEDRADAVKVPGLGDIPLLGRLFSSHGQTKGTTELILAITPHIIRNIHQPDADLATYWSGSESSVRTRPITTEKMGVMKIESKGTSLMPGNGLGAAAQPVIVPPMPENNDSNGNKPMPASPVAGGIVRPYGAGAPPNVPLPTETLPAAGIPRAVPRSPVSNSGSAGMSDAVVDPVQAK